MWASQLIGDDFDAESTEEDKDRLWVVKQLMQHPLWKSGSIVGATFGDGTEGQAATGGSLAGGQPPNLKDPKEEEKRRKMLESTLQTLKFADNGDGWFESQFGKDAESLVKDLKGKRRIHKKFRDDIDDAIEAIRVMKKLEVDSTVDSVGWLAEHLDAARALGLSDRNLKSLRKFGGAREVSLKQVCMQWERANDTINKLMGIEGNWDDTQRDLWVQALQMRKDAKASWRNTLHQADNLTKAEAMWLSEATRYLDEEGPLDTRAIVERLEGTQGIITNKSLSVQKMGALLKTYGPEHDVEKAGRRWERTTTSSDILIKDVWAYAAGFLDADGYITITKRGEPRAGIIATGARGKIHCEQLHKNLECGVLQLDLKVHKNSRRSQHRLQFYSASDLRKLLKGVSPHLRLKKKQAECVLELLDLRGKDSDFISKRKTDLHRIVKWENWKDVKGEELLAEWNVSESDVESWGQQDPEIIQLVHSVGELSEVV